MMTATQNPFLREVQYQFAETVSEWTAYEDLVDEVTHVLSIVRTVARDNGIVGFEDADGDRESSLYGRLNQVLDMFATPGDLTDAVEALEFVINLRGV